MLRTILRPVILCTATLVLLLGGIRVVYGLAIPIAPFALFTTCDDDLCWHEIQPGTTSIFEAETLLRDAGYRNILSFGDQMVEAGLALAAVNTTITDHDTYITSDYDLTVANLAFTRDICSHNVLATWGRPDVVMVFRYRDYRYVYLYHRDDGSTVMFRSDEANSRFVAAELMSPWALERYTRMTFNNYDEVPWRRVATRLGQPC